MNNYERISKEQAVSYDNEPTQEEIDLRETEAKKRYVEKSKTFGDTRSEEEFLGSLKELRSVVDARLNDVYTKYKDEPLPGSYDESQWLEKIKTTSPVFYEYYTTECQNDPYLLSGENKSRKFLINNLFVKFMSE
jgi:hypothetical protein